MSVHLVGSYTPGPGSLSATAGGTELANWAADDTGRIDQWIDVPDSSLGRVTTIDVTVAHPATGAAGCGVGAASTITIDGASSIHSSQSETPVSNGFASVPQALMPRFDVALTDVTFADTVRALSIVNGLQRLSTRPLRPTAVPVDDALDGSTPALVVAGDGGLPESVNLPLSSVDTTFTVSDSEADTELGLDTAVPYAALQVTTVDGMPLLVATSAQAPGELDAMLSWLDTDPTRWFGLSGDILFSAPGAEPMSLSSSELGASDSIAASSTESDRSSVWLVALGAGAALVVAALVGCLLWLRPSRGDHRRRDPQTP